MVKLPAGDKKNEREINKKVLVYEIDNFLFFYFN